MQEHTSTQSTGPLWQGSETVPVLLQYSWLIALRPGLSNAQAPTADAAPSQLWTETVAPVLRAPPSISPSSST
jgi:hypothetical protein